MDYHPINTVIIPIDFTISYNCHEKLETVQQLFTKLRISAHDLLIEHGRYRQPKLPVENRLCTSCKAIEVHFVMTCTAQNGFTRPRKLMLMKFSDDCSGFTNMDLYYYY